MALEWLTWDEAAQATGCPPASLYAHVTAGRIRHRGVRVARGSLERGSVERFASWYQQALEAAQLERCARIEAERKRHQTAVGPPEDGHVWLDVATAAAVLGVSAQYVGRLAAQERLPATRVGRRWWLRRRDVEQLAAARAFAARMSDDGR